MTRARALLVAIATLSLGIAGGAQDRFSFDPNEILVGTASISGVVVSAETGLAIEGARVEVAGEVTATVAAIPPATPPVARDTSNITIRFARSDYGNTDKTVRRVVFTDASGGFSFPRLPAGVFAVEAWHQRYLHADVGAPRSGSGKRLKLADGQQLTVNVPMTRGGAITGIVREPNGEPAVGVNVNAWRLVSSNGFRRRIDAGTAETDDRGVYRLSGLRPGEFVVEATMDEFAIAAKTRVGEIERTIAAGRLLAPRAPGQPQRVSIDPSDEGIPILMPTFAPSVALPSEARKITIVGSEEEASVDIQLRQTPAGMIEGVASGLPDNVGLNAWLISDDPSIDGAMPDDARISSPELFVFARVAPGKYTVYLETRQKAEYVDGKIVEHEFTDRLKMWGRAEVTVDGAATPHLSVQMQPMRTVSGVVRFESPRPRDLAALSLKVTLDQPASPNRIPIAPPEARVQPDGKFTVTGVGPGRMILNVKGAGVLKSAIVDGQDTLDFPFEFTGDRDITGAVITLVDVPSELCGSLTDSLGRPAPDFTIIVAPTDQRYWTPGSRRIVLGDVSPDGRYSIRGLPAGNYLVAAVGEVEPGAEFDHAFLKSLYAAGVNVSITPGGRVSQALKIK